MSLLDKLFSKKVISLRGQQYLLTGKLTDFYNLVAQGKQAVLRFPTRDIATTVAFLQNKLEHRFGKDSRELSDLLAAPLYCAGCHWEYPNSHQMFLHQKELPLMNADETTELEEFEDKGRCPRCGTRESLLVYYFSNNL